MSENVADFMNLLHPEEPGDSAKQMMWNGSFTGVKLYPQKELKIDRMNRLAERMAKKTGAVITHRAEPVKTSMNTFLCIDIDRGVALYGHDKTEFRLLVDEADDIMLSARKSKIRVSFGIHDIWQEAVGLATEK